MNSDQMEGNWKQFAGAVKEKWGKLTDDDITMAKGRAEALAGRLQERYGITKEEAKKQMDQFIEANREAQKAHSAHSR